MDCFEDAVGFAGVHLVGANLIGEIVENVAHVQGVQNGEEEIHVHFQAGFGFGLVQAAALLEQEHAEFLEAGVAQREAIFSFVHAEAAGAAGAGGEEDVAVADFVLGKAFGFKVLHELHQVADGEVGGIALAVVAVLFAELEGLFVGHRHGLALVAEALKRGVHEALVLPGETAEQNCGVIALELGEGPLNRLVEVLDFALLNAGFLLQTERARQPGAGGRGLPGRGFLQAHRCRPNSAMGSAKGLVRVRQCSCCWLQSFYSSGSKEPVYCVWRSALDAVQN